MERAKAEAGKEARLAADGKEVEKDMVIGAKAAEKEREEVMEKEAKAKVEERKEVCTSSIFGAAPLAVTLGCRTGAGAAAGAITQVCDRLVV